MLKRHHRFFMSVQLLRDACVAGFAFLLAYWLRFSGLLPFETPSTWEETLVMAGAASLIWPLMGWLSGLYVSHRTHSRTAEVFQVFKVSALGFVGLVAFAYFFRDERYSRAIVLFWGAFSFLSVGVARIISRILLARVRARGFNLRHVLVVGVGPLAQRVVQTIERQGGMGLRVRGLVAHDVDADLVGSKFHGYPVLGTTAELGNILRAHRQPDGSNRIDQVIVALPVEKLSALKHLMGVLSLETVDVRLIPDVYQFVTLCGSVEEFSGLPLINLQSSPLDGWSSVAKRAFDLTAAGLGLLVLSPLLALVAAMVRIASPGPIFFSQPRVGMDGREFQIYKFRTMRVDAEAHGAKMTAADDPRRTALGTWLRRLSIDELPQLWNVLLGDMSLVGPRPEQPAFIEDFKREIPRYALRHKIKAGMTGWAQVNGMRGNTSIKKRIEMDLYYIENWSLLLDLKIILRTVFGGFLSPHAY